MSLEPAGPVRVVRSGVKPTLVVMAHDRPRSLARLLDSLAAAEIPPGVALVISLDPGGRQERAVRELAQGFAWPRGEKQLRVQEQRLGLVAHFFRCGELARERGAIVLLEDDLVVSPMFYHFAVQALEAYGEDSQVAGISLNALAFNGYTRQPFLPYPDDGDVFFLQVAWYQGQVYTRRQWAAFSDWRQRASSTVPEAGMAGLHPMFAGFPPDEWFPLKMQYLVQQGKFYVFPRESLSTNFGEPGVHFARGTNFFQVPLQSRRRRFRLLPLASAVAVYDAFQEMLPERLNRLTDRLSGYEYTVDLYGQKALTRQPAPLLLTSWPTRRPLLSFGQAMRPHEANVVLGVPGSRLALTRREDLVRGWRARLAWEAQQAEYFACPWLGGGRRLLWRWIGRVLGRPC